MLEFILDHPPVLILFILLGGGIAASVVVRLFRIRWVVIVALCVDSGALIAFVVWWLTPASTNVCFVGMAITVVSIGLDIKALRAFNPRRLGIPLH